MAQRQRYVLLPSRGLRAESGPARSVLLEASDAFHSLDGRVQLPDGTDFRVLDVTREDGPKLIEAETAVAMALNEGQIPLRVVPVVEYRKPRIFPFAEMGLLKRATARALPSLTVRCVNAIDDDPVENAAVVAFTNFAEREGDGGKTDSNGEVTLRLAGGTIERLYIYGPPNYWGAYRENLAISNLTIGVTPVNLSYTDSVRHFYRQSRFNPATGVTVGVLDTGCDPHSDLNLLPGRATVTGEPDDTSDIDLHGTHVAGLIGANGGLHGVAPGVPIRPYRVFPANGDGATNYAILKAMFAAADARCDIVNLSLGGGPYDDIVAEAIQDARNQGMLVVVAAGNDNRATVNFPAAYPGAVAVAAMGIEGTFPSGSVEEADVLRPPYSQADASEFLAAFSNVGTEICVVAPGVGTLSTLPGQAYGPLSGTSMAAPVVAGATACLLSNDTATFGMPRNRARSDAIFNLLVQNCVRRRFGQIFEGFGLPDPASV
ncbi:MAG: S8 family serine peptidase [Sphingomonadaceae bacterium]|nr:S8 family serine peptidase [Sphingomonadaceae bacterium]